MTFHNPEFLVLLVVLLPVGWLLFHPRRTLSLTFPSIATLKTIRPTLRLRLYRALPLLSVAGLALMVVALARPQRDALVQISAEGIAIEMVVDCSGSMRALDFQDERGQEQTRLDVVKEVFGDFVFGNRQHGLAGRPNDNIGLVAFSGYADSKCPLTLDHGALLEVLKSLHIAKPIYDRQGRILNQEDFLTDIGHALAIATARLRNAPNRSRILILLTDGENNPVPGEKSIAPLRAAQAARALGIKIYTIGVGSTGQVPFRTKNIFGEEVLVRQYVKLDEELLKKIARIGHGKYFNARHRRQLQQIYQDIDRLEKTKVQMAPNPDAAEYYAWFLLPGVGLLLLEKLLRHTLLRKVP